MNPKSIVESVKESVAEARSKVEMVTAHGQEAVKTGARTLQAAKGVVVEGGREAVQVAIRTKEELKRTLKDGVAQVGEKLSRLTTPTRKEEALARKLEVKAKKQRKRSALGGEASPAASA